MRAFVAAGVGAAGDSVGGNEEAAVRSRWLCVWTAAVIPQLPAPIMGAAVARDARVLLVCF